MLFEKDLFLQKFVKKNCYKSKNKKSLSYLKKLKKPYFLTYVSKKKLTKKEQEHFNCKFYSKLIIFKKILTKKEAVLNKCRLASKKDKVSLEKIINKSKNYSRFFQDNRINKRNIKKFRKEWIIGYYKNKKNRKLIICEIKKKIAGFILLKDDTNYLRIEQIITNPRFMRKGVGSSLISYVNNIYFSNRNYLSAGTQSNNQHAIKFYKKNKLFKENQLFYQHIYSN